MAAVDADVSAPRRVLNTVVRWSSYLGSVAILWIMASTTADVISRYSRGSSIAGVLEISEIALVIAVYLGMGYAEYEGSHVRTDVVTSRLPDAVARKVREAGLLVMAIFVGWLAWDTSHEAWHSFRTGEYRFGVIEVPIWPAKIAVTLGLFLLTIQAVANLWDVHRGRRDTLVADALAEPAEDLVTTTAPEEDR